jgi:acyl carrier protein
MTRQDIEVAVNGLLSGYLDREALAQDTTIRDLGLDSIDYLELVLRIEETLNVEIDVGEFEKCQTVGDMIGFLQARKAA